MARGDRPVRFAGGGQEGDRAHKAEIKAPDPDDYQDTDSETVREEMASVGLWAEVESDEGQQQD